MDRITAVLLVLSCSCLAAQAAFVETFGTDWEGRWIPSTQEAYTGVFTYAEGGHEGDHGLLVSQAAQKYGIAAELDAPMEFGAEQPVVLQYELKLQKGLECGGAYLKYLQPQPESWTPSELKDNTPYSIMFGPDKCGGTNKVHFIFRHKSPNSGEYVEHHLASPALPVTDKLSHVYTAIIYPNNTLQVLVDGEVKKTADLLSSTDFTPGVIPPKNIPDPDDSKPEDWDERAKIQDPEATKPEDWDEDAPHEIEDADAVKPADWLEDEPKEIDDPEAVKPEDWDEAEDGEWEAPRISNPKCETAGCGEWVRPKKANPAYKGKWNAPWIDNPAYKGMWAPREIPNPAYFELERPHLEPITAIAVEIWTMQDGILFDNFLVSNSVEEAEQLRETEWKPKFEKEKAEKEVEEKKKEDEVKSDKDLKAQIFDVLHKAADIPFLKDYKTQITEFVDVLEQQYPMATFACLSGIFCFFVAFIYSILPSKKSKKVSVEKAKKEDITEKDDEPEAEEAEEDEAEEEPEAKSTEEVKEPPRRRTGRPKMES